MTAIKRRHKPFYKQFLKIRKNVQNRSKLFKFNKQKWKRFQLYTQKQLKFFKRFRAKDQYTLSIVKFASRGNSFQKKFKNNLLERKSFKLFYGGLRKKYLKKIVKKIHSIQSAQFQTTMGYRLNKVLESRLDTVLHRANLLLSIRSARQFILHGHVRVNGYQVRSPSYTLNTFDCVSIVPKIKPRIFINKNIDRSNFWPIPPKHLIINYKTLQIFFMNEKSEDLLPLYSHFLNLDSIITNIDKS
jgi:ribosomal protein S4